MGRSDQTPRSFARSVALGAAVVATVGCGQLLGLDEDRSRLPDDPECACDDANPCTLDSCAAGQCEHVAIATPEQVTGDCQEIVCAGDTPVEQPAPDDVPAPEACRTWSCSDTGPVSTPVTRGARCLDGYCDGAGQCVQCVDDTQCADGDSCDDGVCGCAPLSCADAGLSCGPLLDGCGGTIDCDNGVVDGAESDVDCGGTADACSQRCADGRACFHTNDCESGFCGGGWCAGTWSATMTGETARAVALASSSVGEVAVVGDFTATASFAGMALLTPSSAGFLAAFDAQGAPVFAVELVEGTSSRDVAFDAAGNIVIAGSRGGRPHVEKRDSQGKPLWTLATTGNGVATAMAVDARGHTYVVGELDGAVTFAETLTLSGTSDVFIVELDTAGNVVDGRVFHSVGPQNAVDVALGASRIAIVGNYAGTLDVGGATFDSEGDWDAYAVTMDTSLTAKHVRIIGGASAQHAAGVAIDDAGGLFVAGTFFGTLRLAAHSGIPSAGNGDIFLARLDLADLDLTWVNTYGDAQHQHVAGLALDVHGGVTMAGGFAGALSFGGATLTSAGGEDAFFASIDAQGSTKRSRRFGDQQAQRAVSVAMSAFGSVFVTGAFRGTVDFGLGPVTSSGAEDSFFAAF